VSAGQVLFTLVGFILFYSALLIVDIVLMRKYIRMGPPEALGLAAPALKPSTMPAE
jgi:cytochrome d ubiquinol oxidase subunit I